MKKLLLELAVIAVALTVNAAAAEWNWKTGMGQAIFAPESTSDKVSGTAYLFLATAAEDVYGKWMGDQTWTTAALDNSPVSASGTIALKDAFTYDTESLTAIFAIEATIDGEKYLYISSEASHSAEGVGAATLTFSPTATSQTAALDSYAGAGHWYSAPEPTSGMLLLLGVAGLMLKRKRA